MGTWAWTVWMGSWIGAIACGALGVMLIAWAAAGRRGRGGTGEHDAEGCCAVDAESAARCACCGYALRGLEHGLCPECGWRYDGRERRLPRRKRLQRAMAGAGLMGAAVVLGLLPAVLRGGVAAVMPTAGLAIALPYADSPESAAHRELHERLDRGVLSAGARAVVADRCVEVLERGNEPAEMRLAASALLRRLGADAAALAGRVMGLMSTETAAVREALVGVLSAIGVALDAGDVEREAVMERLRDAAADDPDAGVRRAAVDGLAAVSRRAGGSMSGATVSALVSAVGDSSPRVRTRALCALHGGLGAARAEAGSWAGVVERAAGDRDAAVRDAALALLDEMAALGVGGRRTAVARLQATRADVAEGAQVALAADIPREWIAAAVLQAWLRTVGGRG